MNFLKQKNIHENKYKIQITIIFILVLIAIFIGLLFEMRMVFGVTLLLFTAIFMFFLPDYALVCLIVLSIYLGFGITIPNLPVTIPKLVVGLSLFIFLIKKLKENKMRFHLEKLDTIVLVLLGWVVFIDLFNDSSQFFGESGSLRFISFVILYFLVSRSIKNKDEIIKIMKFIGVSGIILIIFQLLEYQSRSAFQVTNFGKNILAGQLAILTLVSIYSGIISKKKFFKLFFWLFSIIYFFGVLINSSRGALIALLIGLFFFFILNKFSLRYTIIGVLIIFISYLLSLNIPQLDYSHSLLRLQSTVLENESRFLIWKVGFRLIEENLILGVGYGNFITSIPYYALFSGVPRAMQGVAGHNMFMTTLGELGIPGFILFIGLFFILLRKLFLTTKEVRNKNLNSVLQLSSLLFSLTIVFLVQGMVADINFWENLWLHLGVVQSFFIISKKNCYL